MGTPSFLHLNQALRRARPSNLRLESPVHAREGEVGRVDRGEVVQGRAMRSILDSIFVAIIDVVVYRLTTFVIINPDSENQIDKRVVGNLLRL